MASENQATKKHTGPSELVCRPLQAMNLGSLIVGDLARAINWANDPAFTKPECKPWVELPMAASSVTPSDSGVDAVVVSVSSETIAEGRESPVVTEEEIIPKSVDVEPVSAASVAPEAMNHVNGSTGTPTSKMAEPEDAEVDTLMDGAAVSSESSLAAVEAVVVSSSAERVPVEEEVPKTSSVSSIELQATSREISIDSSLSDQPVSSNSVKDRLVDQPPDQGRDVLESSSRPTVDARPAVTEITMALEPEASKIPEKKPNPKITEEPLTVNRPRAARETMNPASRERPSIEVNSGSRPVRDGVPVSRVTPTSIERLPLPKLSSPALRGDQSQDDYLIQLERLVVELNMELARVRGEQDEVDPIEQMANRIIALNLENLALKEKLQQTQP